MCAFMLPLFLQKIHLEKFMSSCSHIKGCISFRMLFTLLNDWVLSSFILKIIKVDGQGGKPLNLIVTKGGRYICLSRAWRGKRIIFNLWKEVFIFFIVIISSLSFLQLKCLSFYDIVLDFIMMDAFDDLENPPSTVTAVVQNRWLSNGFKETVCYKQWIFMCHLEKSGIVLRDPDFPLLGIVCWKN